MCDWMNIRSSVSGLGVKQRTKTMQLLQEGCFSQLATVYDEKHAMYSR